MFARLLFVDVFLLLLLIHLFSPLPILVVICVFPGRLFHDYSAIVILVPVSLQRLGLSESFRLRRSYVQDYQQRFPVSA